MPTFVCAGVAPLSRKIRAAFAMGCSWSSIVTEMRQLLDPLRRLRQLGRRREPEPYAEQFPFAYDPELTAQLAPYLDAEPLGPRVAAYIAGLPKRPVHVVDFLVDLNTALRKSIRYLIRMEPGVQTPEETIELGSGSCRDWPGRSMWVDGTEFKWSSKEVATQPA